MAGALAPAQAEDVVLGYVQGFGYQEPHPGQQAPTEAATAFAVAARSGLQIHWEALPLERQLERLHTGPANFCLLNMFKTVEREAVGRFTESYGAEPAPVIVSTAAKGPAIAQHGTLEALLADARMTLILPAGVSYGAALDHRIEAAAAPVEMVYSESASVSGMLLSGHGDFSIGNKVMAIRGIEAHGYPSSDFAFTAFPDVPLGEPLYFLCHHDIPSAILDRLNAAIRAIPTDQGEVVTR